ncbi:hypothetical protein E8E15_002989 [Penicillium rubens]|nr:hypothetical protein E8E15_002989 [Penicillium rubens]
MGLIISTTWIRNEVTVSGNITIVPMHTTNVLFEPRTTNMEPRTRGLQTTNSVATCLRSLQLPPFEQSLFSELAPREQVQFPYMNSFSAVCCNDGQTYSTCRSYTQSTKMVKSCDSIQWRYTATSLRSMQNPARDAKPLNTDKALVLAHHWLYWCASVAEPQPIPVSRDEYVDQGSSLPERGSTSELKELWGRRWERLPLRLLRRIDEDQAEDEKLERDLWQQIT